MGFPDVRLLGQHVDGFGLATLQDRVDAIRRIKAPTNLIHLEHFLGATGYLRDKISRYAQIAAPLTEKKTQLLKNAPIQGQKRRSFSAKITFILSDTEMKAILDLKEVISSGSVCTHHDAARYTYYDLDASLDGFAVMVYHLQQDGRLSMPSDT